MDETSASRRIGGHYKYQYQYQYKYHLQALYHRFLCSRRRGAIGREPANFGIMTYPRVLKCVTKTRVGFETERYWEPGQFGGGI